MVFVDSVQRFHVSRFSNGKNYEKMCWFAMKIRSGLGFRLGVPWLITTRLNRGLDRFYKYYYWQLKPLFTTSRASHSCGKKARNSKSKALSEMCATILNAY